MRKIIIVILVFIVILLVLFVVTFPWSLLVFGALYESLFLPSDSEISSIIEQAVLTKDLSLCEKVPQSKDFETPRTNCRFKTIISIGNPDLCKSHPYENLCVERIAVSKSDLSVCNLFLEIYSRNPTLGEEVLNECYLRVIVKNSRFSECDKLVLNESCYHSFANYQKDISICYNVKDKADREWCIRSVASNSTDIAICDVAKDTYEKDLCIISIALSRRDEADCEKISDRKILDQCYYNLGRNLADYEMKSKYCDKIESLEIKEACYESEPYNFRL